MMKHNETQFVEPLQTKVERKRLRITLSVLPRCPWGRDRDYGGIGPIALPEHHRPKEEPPPAVMKGHRHFGFGGNPWPTSVPIQQYYDLTYLKKSNVRTNDQFEKQIQVPFPAKHPYQSHISYYAMFPTFKSPDDPDSGLNTRNGVQVNLNVPAMSHDIRVLQKAKGDPYRHEVIDIPPISKRKVLQWPGQNGYYQIPKQPEEPGQVYYPRPPKTVAPNMTLRPWENTLSERTANMLKNLERSQWLSIYSLNFTGNGPMNPLQLDDYHDKMIGAITGKINPFMAELRERSHSAFTPARPFEGRYSRMLQGQRQLESQPQEMGQVTKDSIHTQRFQENGRMELSFLKVQNERDEKQAIAKGKLEHSCMDEGQLVQPTLSQALKITDTAKTLALYTRQLPTKPNSAMLVKKENDFQQQLYYEDLPTSKKEHYKVDHNPYSLSQPPVSASIGFATDRPPLSPQTAHFQPLECSEKSGYAPYIKQAACAGVGYRDVWPQSTLLHLQDSFSKSAAHKRFHETNNSNTLDLRDNIHSGKRRTFYGFNSYYFHN
uniref:Sperm microtubule inner protein 4 n=1 Tax=Erpetoichthys calabaricus TaxID=27687 RepID=A0A8C4THG1_ERPCA